MPAQIPDKYHFLYGPITWTHKVWRQISRSQGNTSEVYRLYNLLPAIEAYIEDKIGLQLIGSLVNETTDILQDRFVQIQVDSWKTDKAKHLPSVLQQLCIDKPLQDDFLSSNFYTPLRKLIEPDCEFSEFMKTMAQDNSTKISASTQTNSPNPFTVDMIDLNNLDLLIQEQQQRDADSPDQDDAMSQTQAAANTNMHIYRIEMKRIFKTPEKTCETFKRFFIALKKIDPHAAVRPVYANDANRIPPISTSTQVQNPELLDLSKYHKSWTPNQRYGLSGQLLIETSHEFNDLVNLLGPWLHTAYYQIMLSECQTSELVTIGTFIRASYTLCRNDLFAATKAVIATLPEESQFEFSFRADNWYCSIGRVNVIFVAVARDKLKQGMDYFCNMYDGVNTNVPNGIKLLFIPLYQIQLTPEMREKIGQEQRAWQDNEIACFVKGFCGLSMSLTLKDGSKCSLRSLLLRLPNNPNCARKTLFHGVDRRPESDEWITLKYSRDDDACFKKRAPGIAFELAQLVVDEDVSKIFVNPEVGLHFGGEWRHAFSANTKSGRRVNPTPSDPALLTHFNSVLSRLQPVTIKRPILPTGSPRQPHPIANNIQSSYASRASSTTYTSTTQINTPGGQTTPTSQTQTRSESVIVIEQYEARFVHVESRLTSVERSVNKSGTMLAKLLRHNGIDLSDDEDLPHPMGAPMEVENQPVTESGVKRVCPSTQRNSSQLNQNKLSPLARRDTNNA